MLSRSHRVAAFPENRLQPLGANFTSNSRQNHFLPILIWRVELPYCRRLDSSPHRCFQRRNSITSVNRKKSLKRRAICSSTTGNGSGNFPLVKPLLCLWWVDGEDDTHDDARHAYLTPDPSSQFAFSSPPAQRRRKPLTAIPVLRPKVSGEVIIIGRSSVQCTHPIPQQWLNLHISRVHVLISYLSREREILVRCRGINPVYMSTLYETHKLEKGGEIKFKEGEDFRVNIAGYVVMVEGPESSKDEFARVSLQMLSLPIITTTYSEPEKRPQSSLINVHSEVQSPSPTPEAQRQTPETTKETAIQIYHDKSESAFRSSLSPPPEDLSLAQCISPVNEFSQKQSPQPTDSTLLDALLTTLIFAEVKPTPLPRLMADLAHRMPNVQQDHIKAVLESCPCVGIVHRSGKDAAGKPLNDEYHYVAEGNGPLIPETDSRR